jgi:2-polyprenyl-6-methoxyphenol hydroxylase-like FAD-dependent oxidoreductase
MPARNMPLARKTSAKKPTQTARVTAKPSGPSTIKTTACVVGGGPAGMMLGFLLARAGVHTTVLEKHADFLRDFRGDTIHPSTMELMYELGLLDEFLKLPHSEVRHLTGEVGKTRLRVADFTHLPVHCRFVAFMPQWHFLNFLAEHGKKYPDFDLHMQTEATDLIEAGGRIAGVRASAPHGNIEIRADLVIGTDGRHSTVRDRAGFQVDNLGAPMDVLWMRFGKRADDGFETLGHIGASHVFVMLDRGDYWQCALVIAKGAYDGVRNKGLVALRDQIVRLAPVLRDRIDEIGSFDDVKLLTVAVDRLPRWYRPGLLCIGDAAHAMSPIGGVGINLAVQDAVAAANLLAGPLVRKAVTVNDLKAVQERRWLPTRITQSIQLFLQRRVIAPTLARTSEPTPPLPLKMVDKFPMLQRLPARLIGMGIRPEHVHTRDASRAAV